MTTDTKIGLCVILICVVSFTTVALYMLNRNFTAFVDMTFFPQEYHISHISNHESFLLPLPSNTAFRFRRGITEVTYTTKTNVRGIIEFYSNIADEGTFFVEHIEDEWHHLRILFRFDGGWVSILLNRYRFYEWLIIDATTEEEMANRRIRNLVLDIEWQSEEMLKSRFSNQAINEAADFKGEIDSLFEFFQGNVIFRKLDSWQLEKSIENDKISEMLLSWHLVVTDQDRYLFFIADFISDMINPDNRGVYTLRVIKAEDADTQMLADWRDMLIPGIYIPSE